MIELISAAAAVVGTVVAILAYRHQVRSQQRDSSADAPPRIEGTRPGAGGRWAHAPPAEAGGPVRPHRGDVISNLGLLSFLLPFPLGPVAWVLGNHDLAEMRAGRMDRAGEPATRVGRLCGKIATLAFLVLFATGLAVALTLLARGARPPGTP